MKSTEQFWDIVNKQIITLDDYIAKIKKEHVTVVRVEDKAKYALCAYQSLVNKLQAAKSHLHEEVLVQKIKNTVEVQDAIREERTSIVEGINDVKRSCEEALHSINKDDTASLYERQTETIEKYISDLTTQKLKIEADIESLEQAKSTKVYGPVENLLINGPNIIQLNIGTPPKEAFRYSWQGDALSKDTIVQEADKLLKKSFYSPFSKVLGKRKRESSTSPQLQQEESNSQKKKTNIDADIKPNPVVNEICESMPIKDIKANTEQMRIEEPPKIEDLPKPNQGNTIQEKCNRAHKSATKTPMQEIAESNAAMPKPNQFEMPTIAIGEFSVPQPQSLAPTETIVTNEITPIKSKMPDPPVTTPIEASNKETETPNIKNNIVFDQFCYFLKPSSEELYVYNISIKSFKKLKKSTLSKKIQLNFAMCVHHGEIFISGGDKDGVSSQVTSAYSIATVDTSFSLVEIASMLQPKRQHTMISADNFIFTIGGFDSSTSKHLKVCERYDGKQWEMMPEITKERRGITGVYQSPYIYAINGNCESSILLFERLDSKTCIKWEEVKVNCNTFSQRFLTAGISINDKCILLFGGYDKEVKKDVFALDTDSMSMIKVSSLCKGDYFYQRTPAINSTFVYCAGNDKPIEIHMYDIINNKWTMSKVEG